MAEATYFLIIEAAMHGQGPSLKVLHIAPHLSQGGGERVLQLVLSADRNRLSQSLLLMSAKDRFYDVGNIAIDTLGFDFSRRTAALLRLAPALKAVRRKVEMEKPDVVVGWLYYGALMSLAIPASANTKVIWSIHNTTFPPVTSNPTLHLADRLLAHKSTTHPETIIYCAESARRLHEKHGYAADKSTVAANGIDIERFTIVDADGRARARLALAVSGPTVLLCCRFDPQKNIPGALDAFAEIACETPDATLLLAGRGMTGDNAALQVLIRQRGLSGRCRLLGPVVDIERCYAAADVVLLASTFGEAMPMTLLEALASGVPIAATAIGDIPSLPVPREVLAVPGDASALASALRFALNTRGSAAWTYATQSVRRDFAIERCRAAYIDAFFTAAGSRKSPIARAS